MKYLKKNIDIYALESENTSCIFLAQKETFQKNSYYTIFEIKDLKLKQLKKQFDDYLFMGKLIFFKMFCFERETGYVCLINELHVSAVSVFYF